MHGFLTYPGCHSQDPAQSGSILEWCCPIHHVALCSGCSIINSCFFFLLKEIWNFEIPKFLLEFQLPFRIQLWFLPAYELCISLAFQPPPILLAQHGWSSLLPILEYAPSMQGSGPTHWSWPAGSGLDNILNAMGNERELKNLLVQTPSSEFISRTQRS